MNPKAKPTLKLVAPVSDILAPSIPFIRGK
jgi:hypothetical protein